jgi:hypothetical protein
MLLSLGEVNGNHKIMLADFKNIRYPDDEDGPHRATTVFEVSPL